MDVDLPMDGPVQRLQHVQSPKASSEYDMACCKYRSGFIGEIDASIVLHRNPEVLIALAGNSEFRSWPGIRFGPEW